MITNVPPPPQLPQEDVPAIYQRFESPEQSILNDVNQGHYGDGFTASIGALAEAKNESDKRNDEESAVTANKDVAAGTGPEPAPGEDSGYDYNSGIGF